MNVSRRDVLTAAAVAGVGVVGGRSAQAAESYVPVKPAKEAKLNLSSQAGGLPGKTYAEKMDFAEKLGLQGFEVGIGDVVENRKEMMAAIKGRPLKISAVCAGTPGDGWLIAADKGLRDKAVEALKPIIEGAGEIGSTGVIIVPAFHHHDKKGSLPHEEARHVLTGFARWDEADRKREGAVLAQLGEMAAKAGTRMLLEPLNRQECYFLRTLADAASICKDVDSPGLAMMGDFWHMTWEETCDLGAFMTAGKYLHHVHMASRRRRAMPGEDGEADNYVQGFKGLKMLGYQDYVSFECGCKGPDRGAAMQVAVEMLRKQWAEA